MRGEVATKLALLRDSLRQSGCSAVRLRGVDWFSWATAGGSNAMLLSAETGIADAFVTRGGAWTLTDVIEAERLRREEVPAEFEIYGAPWEDASVREAFVAEKAAGGQVASDRPAAGERALAPELVRAKRRLLAEEVRRFEELGKDTARAMTEAMSKARPEWTEWELAAQGAWALRKRGIDPALVQVGGEERVEAYRHLLPTGRKIGKRAMMAFCARRHGLYASITRFVSFENPSAELERRFRDVARIESVALGASRPGASLEEIYLRLAQAYSELGHGDQIHRHHQGGTTGYLAREVIAAPGCGSFLEDSTAIAWNPSLPGAKIEDTFICASDGNRPLSWDPEWPSFEFEGRTRPAVWVRP